MKKQTWKVISDVYISGNRKSVYQKLTQIEKLIYKKYKVDFQFTDIKEVTL